MSVVKDEATGVPLLSPDAVLLGDTVREPKAGRPFPTKNKFLPAPLRSVDTPASKPTRQDELALARGAAKQTVDSHFGHLPRKARRKMAAKLAKAARRAAKETHAS